MAMSPAAKALKERKKGKSKKDAEPKDDAPKAEAEGGEALDAVAEFEAGLEKDKGGEVEEVMEETTVAEVAGGDEAPMGDDPTKVFGDVLELDDITAQAVYAEAMGMPELADMSPKEMAEKIKGNYDMLKSIIVSMGEKAAMAMKAELNQPMAPPDMGGAPDMGPDMGGPPMGPGMSGPGMA